MKTLQKKKKMLSFQNKQLHLKEEKKALKNCIFKL